MTASTLAGGAGLSRAAAQLPPSATAALDARAKALIAAGGDIHNLTSGEPAFPTVAPAARAAATAIKEGFTRYTPAAGIPELRAAAAAHLNRHHTSYTPDQVVITAGAKGALHLAFTALLDPGDEVLIPAPYWVSYPHLVTLAGGVPVTIPPAPGTGGKITPDQVREAVTTRTRVLLVNNPSNPSGAVYTAAELRALAEAAAEACLTLVADEICDHWVYGTAHTSLAALGPETAARTVTIGGVSKTFAMTGWRIGWAAAPAPVTAALTALQSHTASAPSSISQRAALGALEADLTGELAARRDALNARRRTVLAALADAQGIQVEAEPLGAFFVFADISGTYHRRAGTRTLTSSEDFAAALLEDAGVAVVPGTGFGAPDHVRISYTVPPGDLADALERISAFTARLKDG